MPKFIIVIDIIISYLGTGLIIIGYSPQIFHLIKEKCTAGLSREAFIIWSVASSCFFIHSCILKDLIFEIVQSISLFSSLIIVLYCFKYKNLYCGYHLSQIRESN